MSRRDTIIIAVLINTGMLAILFMMAIHTEDELSMDAFQITNHFVDEQPVEKNPVVEHVEPIALAQTSSADELDNVLKDYVAPVSTSPLAVNSVAQPPPLQKSPIPRPKPVPLPIQDENQYVEVTVKRGDCLGKIALANNTTVREIKAANSLNNERIDIGQVLNVPVNTRKGKKAQPPKPETLIVDGTEFYTVKRGDNPWKIAKQFHVKFDDLLRLNDLDEEKARNLKVGDRIRVK